MGGFMVLVNMNVILSGGKWYRYRLGGIYKYVKNSKNVPRSAINGFVKENS